MNLFMLTKTNILLWKLQICCKMLNLFVYPNDVSIVLSFFIVIQKAWLKLKKFIIFNYLLICYLLKLREK